MSIDLSIEAAVRRFREAVQEEHLELPVAATQQLMSGAEAISAIVASPSDEGWEIAVGACLGCAGVLRYYKAEIAPASHRRIIGELRWVFGALADVICWTE